MVNYKSWATQITCCFYVKFDSGYQTDNTKYWGIKVLTGICIKVFNFAGIGIEVLRFWSIEVLRFGVVLVLSLTRYQPPQVPKIQDHPNVFSHCLQGYVLKFKLALIVKALLHMEQANGYSPVWVLLCNFKFPLWLKAFSHLEQANGFSPVRVLSFSFKWVLSF